MEETKKPWLSKTVVFNSIAFVVALLSAFGYTGEVSEELGAFVVPAVLLINLVLRFITNKGISLQ